MDNNGIIFLNRLYKDLYLSEEVMHSANKSDTKEERVKKYLARLEKAERLLLPTEIGGNLDLRGLTKAEGLVLPTEIGGNLYLNYQVLEEYHTHKK